jgi:nucleoside-diphosphate-sugar epimerase
LSGLRVLFIGGTGVISSACSWLAVEGGMDLTVVNRAESTVRPIPPEVRRLQADAFEPESLRRALSANDYDVVVDWLAFLPEHVRARTDLLRGRVGHYFFIGSASAYQKPPALLPVTESTPLRNPYWEYSRNKIACEDLLTKLYREEAYPVTVVRPSHTYDKTSVPFDGGWTIVDRLRRGRPIVVHGDGTTLWTLTHHRDFARGLLPLFGHPAARGEAFHITSHESLTWNKIAETMASAAGVPAQIVHVASDAIATEHPEWGAALLGDKAHSAVFDNTKLRTRVPGFTATIPFHVGAREIVAWHDEDPSRKGVDLRVDAAMDRLIERFGSTPEVAERETRKGSVK